jgi:hypothetical protein
MNNSTNKTEILKQAASRCNFSAVTKDVKSQGSQKLSGFFGKSNFAEINKFNKISKNQTHQVKEYGRKSF